MAAVGSCEERPPKLAAGVSEKRTVGFRGEMAPSWPYFFLFCYKVPGDEDSGGMHGCRLAPIGSRLVIGRRGPADADSCDWECQAGTAFLRLERSDVWLIERSIAHLGGLNPDGHGK
jgi:hypothetical protein